MSLGRLALTLGVLCLAVPTHVLAQAAAPAPLAAGQSLAEELTSAPAHGQSGVAVTLGGQFQDGRTETRGVSLDAIVAHTTKRGALLRWDGELSYGKYSRAPGVPLVKAEDNQRAKFTYLQRLRPRLYALGLAEWRRDAIIELDYRAAAEAGAGVGLVEREHLQLFAGASFALGREGRGYLSHSEQVRDLGVMQSLVIRPAPRMMFEQSLRTHVELGNADDHALLLKLSLMSQVTSFAGFKIYYTHQFDALHPVDQAALQREAGIGLQIRFSRGARP